MKNTANKRKSSRHGCAVPIEGRAGSAFDSSATIDISKGGLGFISEAKIPLNQKIPIEIDLTPDGDPILVLGKVKWVVPVPDAKLFRVGLSFDSFLSGSKSRLAKFFK